jgi:hypothetical protein
MSEGESSSLFRLASLSSSFLVLMEIGKSSDDTAAAAEAKFKYYEDDDNTLDNKRATRFDR